MRVIEPMRKAMPNVRVYVGTEKSKEVYLNVEAVKITMLEEGDNILFGQDEKNEDVFYLFKTSKGNGFKLRKQKSGTTALVCNSTGFSRILNETFKPKDKRISLDISPKPITKNGLECYVLISRNDH